MKGKKKRIRFDRIFLCLFFFILSIYLIINIFNIPISNIYILNNGYLSDQQIIEIAKIEDYPSTLKNLSLQIKHRLEQDIYIKKATVYKKWLTQTYINVIENRPLFYYQSTNKTILLDGTSVDDVFVIPTVLNYITDKYYEAFIEQMSLLDIQVLNRISEIEFAPNEVDDNRFLLSMKDGNFVYVDISTFNKMNKYISIIENLPDKNGILYLDYGNNFDIFE